MRLSTWSVLKHWSCTGTCKSEVHWLVLRSAGQCREWTPRTQRAEVNREHHPNELLCRPTHVEAVQKQLEIFLFTCLQNLLVFSNQVQIKSNIRLVQKTISKIIFKGDKIRWNLEQKIPQQQVFHLACVYAHNAFGFSYTLWPFIHCEEHRGQAFIGRGGGNFYYNANSIMDLQNRPFFYFLQFWHP